MLLKVHSSPPKTSVSRQKTLVQNLGAGRRNKSKTQKSLPSQMTEVLEYRMRENCMFACCDRDENHNMPAITFLLEKEETKREKT